MLTPLSRPPADLTPEALIGLLRHVANPITPASRGTSFVALSGGMGLRWILPLGGAAPDAALASWSPYKASSRLLWKAIRYTRRMRMLPLLPGVKKISLDLDAIDWRHYGWEEPSAPLPLFYVGTPGPHRKLVVTLIDRRSAETRIVLKLAIVNSARSKLRHEHETLATLQAENPGLAPAPLLAPPDFAFSTQSWLEGKPVPTSLTSAHIDFLAQLARPDIRLPLEELRNHLSNLLVELKSQPEIGHIAARIEHLLQNDGWDGTVPATRIHGDFAPWNLKKNESERIVAVDWEDSCVCGWPFTDLVHYHYTLTKLLGRSRHKIVPGSLYTAYFNHLGIPEQVADLMWESECLLKTFVPNFSPECFRL